MGEQINYVPYLPTEPPEGLTKWLLEKGKLSREYLIYRSDWDYEPLEDRRVRAVRVSCTACGRQFVASRAETGGCHAAYTQAPFGWVNEKPLESVIDGDATMCPICGAEAKTIHTVHFGGGRELTQEAWTAVVSRMEVPGHTPRLLLTEWMTVRRIDKTGNTSFRSHMYGAWVVEEKKLVRIEGKTGSFGTLSLHPPRQRKVFADTFGTAENIWPVDPTALEGTTAENCKLDRYIRDGGVYLLGYLGLWRKRPQAENLVMMGLTRLLDALIGDDIAGGAYANCKGYAKCESINWREVSPSKMLGVNREQLSSFVDRAWGVSEYAALCWAREEHVEVPEPWRENVELLASRGEWERHAVLKDGCGPQLWKIMRYLERQHEQYNYLRDYWETAGRLGMDLEDGQVRWPKNLKSAHDKAVARYNAKLDTEAESMIGGRAAALGWLCWERDGLLIRPCASLEELRREGKVLHHCVATYDRRYAGGETAILFIRRSDAPDEPYYTLELDEGHLTVRQNRGLRNCTRTEAVRDFEAAWLEWARQKRRKMEKGGNAA